MWLRGKVMPVIVWQQYLLWVIELVITELFLKCINYYCCNLQYNIIENKVLSFGITAITFLIKKLLFIDTKINKSVSVVTVSELMFTTRRLTTTSSPTIIIIIMIMVTINLDCLSTPNSSISTKLCNHHIPLTLSQSKSALTNKTNTKNGSL